MSVGTHCPVAAGSPQSWTCHFDPASLAPALALSVCDISLCLSQKDTCGCDSGWIFPTEICNLITSAETSFHTSWRLQVPGLWPDVFGGNRFALYRSLRSCPPPFLLCRFSLETHGHSGPARVSPCVGLWWLDLGQRTAACVHLQAWRSGGERLSGNGARSPPCIDILPLPQVPDVSPQTGLSISLLGGE